MRQVLSNQLSLFDNFLESQDGQGQPEKGTKMNQQANYEELYRALRPMNKYGRQALDFWVTYRPRALAKLEDPERFFRDINRQAYDMVDCIMIDMREKIGKEGEMDFMKRLGQINMAHLQAEAMMREELIFIGKEPGTEDNEMPRRPIPQPLPIFGTRPNLHLPDPQKLSP